VLDLSATLRGRPLEHVLDLAERRGLIDFAELGLARIVHEARGGERCEAWRAFV
jgi:hypothetical protein